MFWLKISLLDDSKERLAFDVTGINDYNCSKIIDFLRP